VRTRGGFSLIFALLLGCSSTSHAPASSDAGHPADAHAHPDARGDAHAKDASSQQCSLALPTPSDWRLVADGTEFKDALGRVVFLRGVDAGGRSKFAPYVPFDYPDNGYAEALDAYMARAQSWGIDAMRVPFTWAALQPTPGSPPTWNTAWLAQYIALLESAWQHGIYTIVDFHQDVYSENLCGDGFPGWTLPADGGADAAPMHDCPQWELEYFSDEEVMAAFDAFWPPSSPTMAGYFAVWDEMISQVYSTPGVIGFEPFNEPAAGSADLATFEKTTLTSFFSAIAAEMNAKSPKALVFFDGTGLDGVSVSTSLQKPQGTNLVFAPHFYPLSDTTPAEVESGLAMWSSLGKTWNVPVLVGEFGASNTLPTTLGYMQSVFSGLDALGLSGTEWEYSQSVDLWNSESDTIVAPDGGEYPVAQAVIRPYARAVAGANITQSYTPTASYSLSYTAAEGITEVRLPPRAFTYGDGGNRSIEISVTGACYDVVSDVVLLQGTNGAAVTVQIDAAPPAPHP
jgi:endoglycosylceramidase